MKRKTTILIFGGGLNQLTLIQAAKELNVISVVIDPNPNALGKEFADYFEIVAASDFKKTVDVAIKYDVDGIATSQMENPLRLMAEVAEKMDYTFPSKMVIERCRDKFLMKRSFRDNMIPCAKGLLIKQNDNISSKLARDYSFPLIIKPVDAFSSRGVFKVNSLNDILKNVDSTRSYSSNGDIIIEEFLDGKEYSIEAITYQGKTSVVQYTEKIITSYPHTVEIGHIQPADLTRSQRDEITEMVVNSIKALGINNSASHVELKITNEGPKIIEIGARLGGDFIASYLTTASTGVNMDKAAVQVALGIKPDLQHKFNKYSMIKYLELPPGKLIKKINNYKQIENDKHVVFSHVFFKVGDTIPKIANSADRIGVIIVKANSRQKLLENAAKFENKLKDKITLE
jgi:biotin carboxylase